MRKRILLSILILTLEIHLSAAVWPGDTWQTASPESQGMSSAKLAQAPSESEVDIGDAIVIRNGYDVWHYGDAYGRQGNTSSVVRSYLTTLYGIENEGWQIHSEVEMDPAKLAVLADYVGGRGCVVRHGCMIYSWGSQSKWNFVYSAEKPWYAHFLWKALDDGTITKNIKQGLRLWTC